MLTLTWQASTPPCRFPAQSILGVTASSYSLLHMFLLMIFTEASCKRVASSPAIHKSEMKMDLSQKQATVSSVDSTARTVLHQDTPACDVAAGPSLKGV